MDSICQSFKRCFKSSFCWSMSLPENMPNSKGKLFVKINTSKDLIEAAQTPLGLKADHLIISFKMSLLLPEDPKRLNNDAIVERDRWPCKTKKFPDPTHAHLWVREQVIHQQARDLEYPNSSLWDKLSSVVIAELAENGIDSSKMTEETQQVAKTATALAGKKLKMSRN